LDNLAGVMLGPVLGLFFPVICCDFSGQLWCTWRVEHVIPQILENERNVCVELQNKEKK